MSIFVTGATGFVGRAVVRELVRTGRPVLALVRQPALLEEGISGAAVDLATGTGLADLPWEDCDGILHLAAAGVKQASRRLDEAIAVNVLGTQRLLDVISRQQQPFPLVFARTYYEDFLEQLPLLRENPYVVTKAAGTSLVRAWAGRHPEWPVAAARVFQVYGPGDDPNNLLPYVVQSLRSGQQINMGSGRAVKDWIHVDDAAAAICAISACLGPGWSEWDVGSRESVSVRQVVETLVRISGSRLDQLNCDATRDRPDADVRCCATKLPPQWRPRISLAQGLLGLWKAVK
jgi:UDP-glucose 4-epimerase